MLYAAADLTSYPWRKKLLEEGPGPQGRHSAQYSVSRASARVPLTCCPLNPARATIRSGLPGAQFIRTLLLPLMLNSGTRAAALPRSSSPAAMVSSRRRHPERCQRSQRWRPPFSWPDYFIPRLSSPAFGPRIHLSTPSRRWSPMRRTSSCRGTSRA